MITLEECKKLVEREHEWETSKLYRPIEESLTLRTFKEAPITVLANNHSEILKEVITRYEVGDFCSVHKDASWKHVREGYKAYAVWITPLNSDYEGGELYVNDEVIKQVVGESIKFDRRIRHSVSEVTKGTRYSLVSWLFLKAR